MTTLDCIVYMVIYHTLCTSTIKISIANYIATDNNVLLISNSCYPEKAKLLE